MCVKGVGRDENMIPHVSEGVISSNAIVQMDTEIRKEMAWLKSEFLNGTI